MASLPGVIAAASSILLRLATFCFLRWIPGHHFPPIIISSAIVHLTCALAYPDGVTSRRPSSDEVFQAIAKTNPDKQNPPGGHHVESSSLTRQSDANFDPLFDKDDVSFWQIVVLGVPNWKKREYTHVTIGINIFLALLTLQYVFLAPLQYSSNDLRFSRVGYVGQTSVKVLVREPDNTQLPIYTYYRASSASEWQNGDKIWHVDSETDYTHPIIFSSLEPSTAYAYSLSNNLSGSFHTAPSPHSAASHKLTFLTSSCIKANFPYRPFAHALSIHGFEHLSNIIQTLPSPASFMLFLGDFIYVDVPLRLSSTISHYRSEYRRVYASPSWSLPGLSDLPWYHTLDDHEIANDWSAGNDTEPFPSASDPFIHYHASANPPVPPSSPSTPGPNTTYFQFVHGPASFFMLDTRRYRTNPEPQSTTEPSSLRDGESYHTMLGATQLASLLTYLSTSEPADVHFKIITSSVPFTKNWRFGTTDTWGGFLGERTIVLAAMHAAERELGVRVIVLSGDRHEFGAVKFPPLAKDVNVKSNGFPGIDADLNDAQAGPHEFSVGPLSMFYLPIRTFKQVDDEDMTIKYLPDGNSKFGVVDIETLEFGENPRALLKYSLYIDGKMAWEYRLASPGPTFKAPQVK